MSAVGHPGFVQGFCLWIDPAGRSRRADEAELESTAHSPGPAALKDACHAWELEMPVPGSWHRFASRRIAGRWMAHDDAPAWIEKDGVGLFFRGRLDKVDGEPIDRTRSLELLLARYRDKGSRALDDVIGPCVLIIDDPERDHVLLLRDALGDRSALYARMDDGWLVASDERAFVASHCEPDPEFLQRSVNFLHPEADRTALAGVREVPPGWAMELGDFERGDLVQRITWPKVDHRTSEADHQSAVTEALVQSIGRRLDPDGPTAIAVSGGMDSTLIAGLARHHFPDHELKLLSYRFREFESVDESRYVADLAEELDLDVEWVDGDDCGPFMRSDWLRDLNCGEPFVDAYRHLRLKLHAQARSAGCQVLLTGDFGDHLFLGHAYWLRDLFLTGRIGFGLSKLLERLGDKGLFAWRRDPVLRRCLPGVGLRADRPVTPKPWSVPRTALSPVPRRGVDTYERGDRVSGFFSTGAARGARMGHEEVARFGLDLRWPFRDREFLETFAHIPATLHFDGDRFKVLARRIGRDLLPRSINDRSGKTTFEPLLLAGLNDGMDGLADALLTADAAFWRRWLNPRWIASASREPGSEGLAAILYALGIELWSQATLARKAAIDGVDTPQAQGPNTPHEYAEDPHQRQA